MMLEGADGREELVGARESHGECMRTGAVREEGDEWGKGVDLRTCFSVALVYHT